MCIHVIYLEFKLSHKLSAYVTQVTDDNFVLKSVNTNLGLDMGLLYIPTFIL